MLHSVNAVAFKAFLHKITSIYNFFVIWLYVVTVHFESDNPNLSLTNSSKKLCRIYSRFILLFILLLGNK